MTRLARILALALVLAAGGALAVAPWAAAADPAAPVQKASVSAPAKATVNINTATAKELTKLDGIGDKLAKAIVDYRTQNGPFKAPQDLMKVKGIGEKKFAALKPLITVQ